VLLRGTKWSWLEWLWSLGYFWIAVTRAEGGKFSRVEGGEGFCSIMRERREEVMFLFESSGGKGKD
jgi:hypothetical protein